MTLGGFLSECPAGFVGIRIAIATCHAASLSASGPTPSWGLNSVSCWANSRYRQYALASRICSGVRQSASNTVGEATRTQRHWAREVATLSRFRL